MTEQKAGSVFSSFLSLMSLLSLCPILFLPPTHLSFLSLSLSLCLSVSHPSLISPSGPTEAAAGKDLSLLPPHLFPSAPSVPWPPLPFPPSLVPVDYCTRLLFPSLNHCSTWNSSDSNTTKPQVDTDTVWFLQILFFVCAVEPKSGAIMHIHTQRTGMCAHKSQLTHTHKQSQSNIWCNSCKTHAPYTQLPARLRTNQWPVTLSSSPWSEGVFYDAKSIYCTVSKQVEI